MKKLPEPGVACIWIPSRVTTRAGWHTKRARTRFQSAQESEIIVTADNTTTDLKKKGQKTISPLYTTSPRAMSNVYTTSHPLLGYMTISCFNMESSCCSRYLSI